MKSQSKIKTWGLQALAAGSLLLNALPGQAQVLGDDGVGEVLLFSFFSTQQGWDSYLNISHQPGDSGAFRVLIREGYDGEKVTSFNVYNSSTWRASLSAQGDGSVLRVAEGGCLVTGSTQMEGAGAEIALPTSMGMVEVYALPTPPETVGESCDQIGSWSRGGRWLSGVAQQTLVPPYAELSGEMMLVNVAKGLATEYPAIAFREFMHNPVHAKPQADKPDLSSAREGAYRLNQLLQVSEDMLGNDVTMDASINAQTDWIISYPLIGYEEPLSPWDEIMVNGELRQCDSFAFPAKPGGPSLSVVFNVVPLWQMNKLPALKHQEGMALDVEITPLPTIQVEPALCYGVNVVSFGDQGAMIIDGGDVRHYAIASNELIEGVSYVRWSPARYGRAAVAYKLTSFQNGTLQGGSVLANYAIMKRHVEH
ncbi:hypothetical protein [Nitrincola alkalilacustris]|uniref:hypothetical protein n=1 Tax=Nitrincola alkalilacustris TaxID=1571224 RepID=UPI00124D1095|nr:hypothetical protein [Nitrincola alkalilacustris]